MTELYRTINASAHDIPLDDGSVHCIVTSPPYWGLRSYKGDQRVEWPAVTYRMNEWTPEITINGCDPDCDHEWVDASIVRRSNDNLYADSSSKQMANAGSIDRHRPVQAEICLKCGGWRGGLGMEPDPPSYIGHLILCLREWRRILRDDGTAWINLGDSFAGSGGAHTLDHANPGISRSARRDGFVSDGGRGIDKTGTGLKRKDMVGIPWMFAMAARADGWHLRSDIIWQKSNAMPESVDDRPTNVHEYLFLLSKQRFYYYDSVAIREPSKSAGENRGGGKSYSDPNNADVLLRPHRLDEYGITTETRNRRTVWTLPTASNPLAHFAVFPECLVEPCIMAGTSAHGCCSSCGAPWERITDKEFVPQEDIVNSDRLPKNGQKGLDESNGWGGVPRGFNRIITTGWRPTCDCYISCTDYDEGEPQIYWETFDGVQCSAPVLQKCVVLDPFHGSGTTGIVALRLGRAYVGVDISSEYLDGVSRQRMQQGAQIGFGL